MQSLQTSLDLHHETSVQGGRGFCDDQTGYQLFRRDRAPSANERGHRIMNELELTLRKAEIDLGLQITNHDVGNGPGFYEVWNIHQKFQNAAALKSLGDRLYKSGYSLRVHASNNNQALVEIKRGAVAKVFDKVFGGSR